ncbi:hypothetical protein [Lachnoclostridium sp. Marseille-P6806]|uniref:hypothetical protein n=1 Tax=Lachnoclostridium sp. Marseille-P6806 TaxID=2364793 RepID=UPI001030304C|nr:hypothetical protein [Lachnoclostridium sp. Marseille-P6806]
MASTKSNSTTKQKSQTESSMNSATVSQQTGGGHSIMNTASEYGSTTNTHSETTGGSQSNTFGKSWLSGQVDENTAAQRTEALQNYQTSGQVQQTYQRLQDTLNNRPTFNSQYKQRLDDMYDKIMGAEKFSYNFNKDAMYRLLKDEYGRNGKTAMQNTIGQSAALTGGYANSWAQTAGQQQYQQYLQNLASQIPALRQQAYEEYRQEQQDLKDKYNLTNSAYQNEYGEYRDRVGDWQSDRGFLQNQYMDERNFDYNKYSDNRNFWNDEYWKERSAETSNASETNERNWSTTNSVSNTRGWERSQSETNSSNWSNSQSNTLQNSLSRTQAESNTTSNSWSSGSGSGSGKSVSGKLAGKISNGNGDYGMWYKTDAFGNYTDDQKGRATENGKISYSKLSNAVKDVTRRKNTQWAIDGMTEEQLYQYLDEQYYDQKMNKGDVQYYLKIWEDAQKEKSNSRIRG